MENSFPGLYDFSSSTLSLVGSHAEESTAIATAEDEKLKCNT